jgi:hypothetical protein
MSETTPSVFDVLGTGPSALSLREFLRCDEDALRREVGRGR